MPILKKPKHHDRGDAAAIAVALLLITAKLAKPAAWILAVATCLVYLFRTCGAG